MEGALVSLTADQMAEILELPTTEGGWGTIVADPGWPFSDMGSRATPDYLRRSPMTLEEIRNLPVQAIRAEQSHLYLWAVDAHLEFALGVIRAWGFEFKHTIPWVKRRPAYMGGKPGELMMGLGHYYRKAHELCLFATAGECKVHRHDQLSVIEAPRRAHSEKPERLQDLAEIMSPGPRLELFARRQRKGWISWGDESGSDNNLREEGTTE